MHVEQVEIYSDATNAAVLRHPGRHFPGVLVQGDTLWTFWQQADAICLAGRDRLPAQSYKELNELRNALQSLLAHYKVVLAEHSIPLPFPKCRCLHKIRGKRLTFA